MHTLACLFGNILMMNEATVQMSYYNYENVLDTGNCINVEKTL